MTELIEKTAKFHTMSKGTQEDWDAIMSHAKPFARSGGERVLNHLRLLDGDFGGFAVDRLTHCLQTATRAHRDGKPEDYVVMALLHDIGDTLGAYNHADVAATIMEPFVSEELHWIVKHHAIFQGNNFFHFIGLDPDMRDKFAGSPHYDATVEFIEKYDCPSFEPEYESLPLEFFEPMVMRMFEAPRTSVYKAAMD